MGKFLAIFSLEEYLFISTIIMKLIKKRYSNISGNCSYADIFLKKKTFTLIVEKINNFLIIVKGTNQSFSL